MVVFDDSAMTMMQINMSPKTQWELDEVNYVQSGALGRPTNPDDEDRVGVAAYLRVRKIFMHDKHGMR